MRKIVVALMAAALTFLSFASVFAEKFDLDIFHKYESIFEITENEEKEFGFIDADNVLTVEQRSFEHRFEHPTKYSFVYTDILVHNYFENNPSPILRTWFTFSTTERIDATSVTITLEGNDYTFSDIETDNTQEDEDGFVEQYVIVYGEDNQDFVLNLDNYLADYEDDLTAAPSLPFVLHGTKNVSGEMNGYVLEDFYLVLAGFSCANGLDYLDQVSDASPMKISAAN